MTAATDNQLVLTNCKLFTATSEDAIENGAVWVDGEHIRYAGPASGLKGVPDGVLHKDLGGRFVMPGMTEGHAHLSFSDNSPFELGSPTQEAAMMAAVRNCRMMLGSGFTSAISFGSVHKVDIHLREGINTGKIPGPRLRAAGRDIGTTASNVDSRGGLSMIADGPWGLRKIIRDQRYDQVEIAKIFLDGEGINPHAPPGELAFTDEEVAAVVDEAHRHGMRVACHARGAEAVKQAVRHGVDLIGHANYADDEAIDMLAKVPGGSYIGPGIAWEVTFLENLGVFGFPPDGFHATHYTQEVEATVVAMKKMIAKGIKLMIGGDYGISIAPHGAYAKDMQYFVEMFGMSNAQALLCATRNGGEAADPEGMIGTLEEGKYADLVIVNGDPLEDIAVLQDHDRIDAVMKGGKLYRGLAKKDPFGISPDELGPSVSRTEKVLEPAQ